MYCVSSFLGTYMHQRQDSIFEDLPCIDKASHLTAWDSSPHLPVTPAQLMRPGIGHNILLSGWLCITSRSAFFSKERESVHWLFMHEVYQSVVIRVQLEVQTFKSPDWRYATYHDCIHVFVICYFYVHINIIYSWYVTVALVVTCVSNFMLHLWLLLRDNFHYLRERWHQCCIMNEWLSLLDLRFKLNISMRASDKRNCYMKEQWLIMKPSMIYLHFGQ